MTYRAGRALTSPETQSIQYRRRATLKARHISPKRKREWDIPVRGSGAEGHADMTIVFSRLSTHDEYRRGHGRCRECADMGHATSSHTTSLENKQTWNDIDMSFPSNIIDHHAADDAARRRTT